MHYDDTMGDASSPAVPSPVPASPGENRRPTTKRTWLGQFLADMIDIPWNWNGIIGSLIVGMLISAGAGRIHDMEKDVTQLKLQVQRRKESKGRKILMPSYRILRNVCVLWTNDYPFRRSGCSFSR